VIASLDGEGARVLAESGAGAVCPAEDARALADAVRHLHQLGTEARAAMGQAGRRYYLEHFEPRMLARRLVQRFEALGGGRPGARAPHSPMETDHV
jgi:glycosyltransferase involved in cell wall biosynthesis